MKLLNTAGAVIFFIVVSGCGPEMGSTGGEVNLTNEIDSVSYSLGLNVAENAKNQGLTEINTRAVAKAFEDVFGNGETLVTSAEAGQYLNSYFTKAQAALTGEQKKEGVEWLAKNGTRDGVVTLPSGLQYEILVEGSGEKPTMNDRVTTHYHGSTIDGNVFDSSVDRGQPATFAVGGVIRGWQEALVLMPEGSKWKLFVPSDLAYGERGAPPNIGPHATLIFEVELIAIERKQIP